MKTVVFDAREEEKASFIEVFGESVRFIEAPLTDKTVSEVGDAEIVSVFVSSAVTEEVIDAMPRVRLITTRSTGFDHIAVRYAQEKGITVSSVPGYGERTVAEFTFALLLTISRKIFDAYHQIREKGDFGFAHLRGFDLHQKTIGVVGTGRIGMNVIKIAQGFGMRVLTYDLFPKEDVAQEMGYSCVDLPTLLRESDVVTLHLPLTKETYHLLGEEEVVLMKKGAILINTARGELVDTTALITHLENGHLAGAGLDVLEGEKELKDEAELISGEKKITDVQLLLEDHILIDMPQVVVTPHIAFYTKEAEEEIVNVTIKNITSFAEGNPANVVVLR